MLERALSRVQGKVSKSLQQLAERRFPEMIEDLMLVALGSWADHDWHTFDRQEVNCTAQLYRWLRIAKRGSPQFVYLNVELEYLNLTPAMLAGEESVVNAQRPDLSISIGETGIHVECKRLLTSGPWCHHYVHKGIQRFVSSSYGANEQQGMMVGYIQQATLDGLLGSVNGFVEAHPMMGSGHQLATAQPPASYGSRHRSHHVRTSDVPIDLSHYWVLLGESLTQAD
ncbi:hypothetical protein MMIN_06000 [Mycolicibacter minnesotensis]|nr:hypothetical protein MMIN_06000 [Mycolicibacter minnesotensis]